MAKMTMTDKTEATMNGSKKEQNTESQAINIPVNMSRCSVWRHPKWHSMWTNVIEGVSPKHVDGRQGPGPISKRYAD